MYYHPFSTAWTAPLIIGLLCGTNAISKKDTVHLEPVNSPPSMKVKLVDDFIGNVEHYVGQAEILNAKGLKGQDYTTLGPRSRWSCKTQAVSGKALGPMLFGNLESGPSSYQYHLLLHYNLSPGDLPVRPRG
ncbi:hypothetical protein EYZ11_007230 [Aspergillus tanneri]|uniref:Uncharacterized protein n=1 Tax=Aspergillus tanneri TaxID=1220188 RepID=A0A4S3JE06_9EURO|nr:hypothetical protein EYZ11_007230 [Aspergillus tanneri]